MKQGVNFLVVFKAFSIFFIIAIFFLVLDNIWSNFILLPIFLVILVEAYLHGMW